MVDVPVNPSNASVVVVVTSDGQVAFNYDFRADFVDDLKATHKALATGVETALVGGVNFIASGLGTASGGQIALTTFTNTKVGDTITIYRDIEIDRTTDYTRDLFAEDLNAEQDRVFMIAQELRRDINRAVKSAIGADPISITQGAAGQMLFFDVNGDLVPGEAPSGAGNMNTAVYDPALLNAQIFNRLPVMPEAFGATFNGADDKAAIVAAANYAVANKRPLHLSPGRTYTFFGAMALAAGLAITGTGTLRAADDLTVATDINLTIGNNAVCEKLNYSVAGTGTNTDVLRLGDNVTFGGIELASDVVRAGGGIIAEGDRVRVGYIKTTKIDRPYHLYNTSPDFAKTGNYLGFLECESYVRAFRATFVSGVIGPIRVKTRSPNASKSPGHNAVLIVGCPNLEIGDVWAEGTGEHVVRVGGSEDVDRPNLFPNPENVSGWTSVADSVITANASVAPDLATTADRITKAGVGSTTPFNNATVTAAAHTFSAYVKYFSGSGWLRVRCANPDASFYFNAQTGAIGTVGASWSSVQATSIGSGWYRVSGVITPAAGAVGWGVVPVTADNNTTADTGAVDVWGVNVELGTARSPYMARTRALKVGRIFGIRPGGCVLKCNPTTQTEPGVTEKAYDCTVAGVFGIDVGEGTPEGNEELIRLTHAFGWNIGPSYAFRSDFTTTAQSFVRVNDINDVKIESVGGDNSASGSIIIDGTSDVDGVNQFGGDIVDFDVTLTGQTSGNDSVGVDTAFNLNRVSIHCKNHHGFAVNFLRWTAGTLTGPFVVTGTLAGAVAPAFVTPPASDNFIIDLQWQNKAAEGRATGARFTATREIIGGVFSSASQAPTGFMLNSSRATAGSGNYGTGLEGTRLGSSRRGWAITPRQGSADDKEVGISFFVGDTNTTSNEALLEAMILQHTGRPSFPVLPTLTAYADNAAATAGGLAVGEFYRDTNGIVRVRF